MISARRVGNWKNDEQMDLIRFPTLMVQYTISVFFWQQTCAHYSIILIASRFETALPLRAGRQHWRCNEMQGSYTPSNWTDQKGFHQESRRIKLQPREIDSSCRLFSFFWRKVSKSFRTSATMKANDKQEPIRGESAKEGLGGQWTLNFKTGFSWYATSTSTQPVGG